MKLSSSSEVLAENKVLILYILDQINEPVLDSTLLEVVSSVTDLNYFYFHKRIKKKMNISSQTQ